jgi:hypothetical protein
MMKTRMRSLSKKTRSMIIFGSLLVLVLIAGVGFTNRSVPAQAESSPTPAVVSENGQLLQKSGDTEGLILGAGIILFIILSGVVIQRTVLKGDEN